ncbi:hypothetical protein ASE27_03360 [Oerskovia sp. Root918]|nr:hypothetical protein ASE27_03360 [Oerskovia sp. Root918]
MSGSVHSAIARLDPRRFWPKALYADLTLLETVARQRRWPSVCCACSPDVYQGRIDLERAAHAMPRGPARELRLLLASLDARILASGAFVVEPPARGWWTVPPDRRWRVER